MVVFAVVFRIGAYVKTYAVIVSSAFDCKVDFAVLLCYRNGIKRRGVFRNRLRGIHYRYVSAPTRKLIDTVFELMNNALVVIVLDVLFVAAVYRRPQVVPFVIGKRKLFKPYLRRKRSVGKCYVCKVCVDIFLGIVQI